MNQLSKKKVPLWQSFYRSQISSFLATAVDYILYFLLFKWVGLYYGLASGLGAIGGAIVSFFMGRHWAFKRKDGKFSSQAIRYAITSSLSVFFNTSGMVWLTETFQIHPDYSKVIVSILVGIFFNFLMFRYFVYK